MLGPKRLGLTLVVKAQCHWGLGDLGKALAALDEVEGILEGQGGDEMHRVAAVYESIKLQVLVDGGSLTKAEAEARRIELTAKYGQSDDPFVQMVLKGPTVPAKGGEG